MKVILTALLFATLATSAHAFPKAPFNAFEPAALLNSQDIDLAENQAQYDFEGIVKLSNCSGAIIRFAGQPATSKAYVLTNGHCFSKGVFGGMVKPGEVVFDKESSRSMKVYTKEMKLLPITATKVSFAAMTDTDVALYELNQTYAELIEKYGIAAFELSPERPSIGMAIDIVSGYWDRGYTCEIDDFIWKLKEGDYLFSDSIRYTDGCNTIGGTSGSPIILKGTRKVVAVNNTANEKGKLCEINNPCEITENGGKVSRTGKRYGQQTYKIYSCLTLDFKIDLKKSGCLLPKPQ